jgi:hypothetical protein
LTDVDWSPYVLVEKGTQYTTDETFYLLNDHSMYEEYNYTTENKWNEDLNNNLIYSYNTNYTNHEERTIQSLTLLDALID